MKLKFSFILLLPVLVVLLLPAGCADPVQTDKGTFTIYFAKPQAQRSVPTDGILENLVYTVALIDAQGNEKEKRGNITAYTDAQKFTVTPGAWTVVIEAYLDGKLFAEGSDTFTIESGPNGVKEIKMETVKLVIVPGDTLASKLSWLAANAMDGFAYIIEVNADESIEGALLSYGGKNVTITLKGDTMPRTVSLKNKGSMFAIGSGVTFILEKNIILQGLSDNIYSVIFADTGGCLEMNEGSKITGNYSEYGGAVTAAGNFIMNGGEISGNTALYSGGGIHIDEGASFTMKGGDIYENNADYGGGINSWYGVIILEDGKIYNNKSTGSGGGIGANNVLTIKGGEIFNNEAVSYIKKGGNREDYENFSYGGGVHFYDGDLTLEGGSIYGNSADSGGGIEYNSAALTMTGGNIYGNTAYSEGGGIRVWDGKFEKTGGTVAGIDSETPNRIIESDAGHAIYAASYNGDTFVHTIKYRNRTAGPLTALIFDALDPKNVTYSGAWDEEEDEEDILHEIIFIIDGGEYTRLSVLDGYTWENGAPPFSIEEKEGYIFDGWYKDDDCTELYDFAAETVTAGITLYARWLEEEEEEEEEEEGSSSITVKIWTDIEADVNRAELTVSSDYNDVSWYIFGNIIGTGNTLEIIIDNYDPDTRLTVIMWKYGVPYSVEILIGSLGGNS